MQEKYQCEHIEFLSSIDKEENSPFKSDLLILVCSENLQ